MSEETDWFVSSYKCGQNNSCVETRRSGGGMQVRDTKDNGTGPTLNFDRQAWTAFLGFLSTVEA